MNIWYFHPYGGAPGFGKYLRPYFLGREWLKSGHAPTAFVSRYHHLLDTETELPAQFNVDGVEFRSLPARPYSGNGVARLLNMFGYCLGILRTPQLKLPKPDVVILSSPHPFGIFSCWWIARKYRAALVFEVRDIWPLSITEMSSTPSWHPIVLLAAIAEKFAYRRSDLVASLLGNAEPHMRAKGLAEGKFVFVPNGEGDGARGIARVPVSAAGAAAARQIDAWRSEGRTILIHPGTQGYPSALDLLLDAAAILNQRIGADRYGILLVGGGDTDAALAAQAKRLQLSNVAFCPPVPKAEALWLTSNCDIGYAGKRNFKTVFKYGISFNKIIDFMSAGLPVILPITTAGDPVSNSGCGLVTGSDVPSDIAACIETLVSMSPSERAKMGDLGKKYLEQNLSYQNIGRQYLDALEAIVRKVSVS